MATMVGTVNMGRHEEVRALQVKLPERASQRTSCSSSQRLSSGWRTFSLCRSSARRPSSGWRCRALIVWRFRNAPALLRWARPGYSEAGPRPFRSLSPERASSPAPGRGQQPRDHGDQDRDHQRQPRPRTPSVATRRGARAPAVAPAPLVRAQAWRRAASAAKQLVGQQRQVVAGRGRRAGCRRAA